MIRKFAKLWAGLISTLALTGCVVTPPSIVAQAKSDMRPAARPPVAANGAIFQATQYRSLFEDRTPRYVGDIVTITIAEKTTAGKQATSSASKSGSATATVPKLFGLPATTIDQFGVTAGNSSKSENKADETSGNNFTGTITATVIDVLGNGNLVVAGEKQIALDHAIEYVRFSGVVRPDQVVGGVISSTQVADARIEYRTNSRIDQAEFASMLTRFFLSVVPF